MSQQDPVLATPLDGEIDPAHAPAEAPLSRPSWSGLLHLGLLAIPIKAFPALLCTPPLPAHLLHAGCGQRLHYLASPYRPGRRCAFWKKLKPWNYLPAVIVGYVPGPPGVRRLLVAAQQQGQRRFVAELQSGLSATWRQQLAGLLARRCCSHPAVPCRRRAIWVRPELSCQVRFLGWIREGRLRHASFACLLPTIGSLETSLSLG